jgi:hypothetical protein
VKFLALHIEALTPDERMELFDSLPRHYRDVANLYGLARALVAKADDDEIAAFEADHAVIAA